MGLYGPLRDVLHEAHGDLLGIAFWRRMQGHEAGEVVDILPYRPSRRLRAGPGTGPGDGVGREAQ